MFLEMYSDFYLLPIQGNFSYSCVMNNVASMTNTLYASLTFENVSLFILKGGLFVANLFIYGYLLSHMFMYVFSTYVNAIIHEMKTNAYNKFSEALHVLLREHLDTRVPCPYSNCEATDAPPSPRQNEQDETQDDNQDDIQCDNQDENQDYTTHKDTQVQQEESVKNEGSCCNFMNQEDEKSVEFISECGAKYEIKVNINCACKQTNDCTEILDIPSPSSLLESNYVEKKIN